MSTNLNYKQVANVERRTWDIEAYEKKARQRQENLEQQEQSSSSKHKTNSSPNSNPQQDDDDKEEFRPAMSGAAGPEGSDRAFLQARKGKVTDIDSRVGTIEMVSAEAATVTKVGNDQGIHKGVVKTGIGWHCRVCDCFLKDSHTYLDHINGRKHQRKLGFSMRVERSTQDDLQATLQALQQQKQEAQNPEDKDEEAVDFSRLVQAKDEELERRRKERKQKRKDRKKQLQLERAGGLPSATEESTTTAKDETEAGTATKETTDNGGDDEEPEVDPGLAAMMGFSAFG